jgi:hypothetical protein
MHLYYGMNQISGKLSDSITLLSDIVSTINFMSHIKMVHLQLYL